MLHSAVEDSPGSGRDVGENLVADTSAFRLTARHKAITDMGKKGYSLQEIANAAGHSQISTTLRYTHLRAEATREVLESLGQK